MNIKPSSTSPLREAHHTNAEIEQSDASLARPQAALFSATSISTAEPVPLYHLKHQGIKSSIPMSPTDKFISPCSRKIFSDRFESKKKSSSNPLAKRFEELKNEYSVKKDVIKHHLSTQTNAIENDENTFSKSES